SGSQGWPWRERARVAERHSALWVGEKREEAAGIAVEDGPGRKLFSSALVGRATASTFRHFGQHFGPATIPALCRHFAGVLPLSAKSDARRASAGLAGPSSRKKRPRNISEQPRWELQLEQRHVQPRTRCSRHWAS